MPPITSEYSQFPLVLLNPAVEIKSKLLAIDWARAIHLNWTSLGFLISVLIIAMTAWEKAYERAEFLKTLSREYFNPYHVEEFDYIIIGGGSAGSVVANRLSKNKMNSVLLLEAGGVTNFLLEYPAMCYVGQLQVPAVDWMFETLSQPNTSLGLNDHKVRIPRGKGLGGSSNLNLMYYQRGNPRDYDRWANITGDPEWSFENVLPYFKSTVNYHGNHPNPKYQNIREHDGEGLYVGKTLPYGIHEFLTAAREKGYHVEDPNGIQRESFSRMDVTIKDGKRFGTYQAFIKPIQESRGNLKIYLYSRAIKIHLDRQKTAYGVTYLRHGIRKFVRARKEIIVSAGSIDSPRLLLLSGIGPREDLHRTGLSCRANLPVGHNFQDHPLTLIFPFTAKPGYSVSYLHESNLATLQDYFYDKSGLISTPDASSGVGYVRSSLAEKDWPDVQYTLVNADVTVPMFAAAHNIKLNEWEKYSAPYIKSGKSIFGIAMVLGLPRSRGQVRLRSSNPLDKPIIDANYFSHPDDMKIFVDGMRIAVNLVEKTKAYREIDGGFANTAYPGCEGYDLRSDEYYECYLRKLSFTVHHPSCTVPMGKSVSDYPAVVDSKLRVFKTNRLRVIDASVMPMITNANLNAPTIMIGEKGAFFILDYWAQQYEVCIIQELLLLLKENTKCYYYRLP